MDAYMLNMASEISSLHFHAISKFNQIKKQIIPEVQAQNSFVIHRNRKLIHIHDFIWTNVVASIIAKIRRKYMISNNMQFLFCVVFKFCFVLFFFFPPLNAFCVYPKNVFINIERLIFFNVIRENRTSN